jgi:hypothetical protein
MPYGPRNAFTPNSDRIGDWILPGASNDPYPDDWFVPPPAATPNAAQPASNPAPDVPNPAVSNRPAPRPNPLEALWSLIPLSRLTEAAWDPPIFPDALEQYPRPTPAPRDLPPLGDAGGLFDAVATLRATNGDAAASGSPLTLGFFANPFAAPPRTPLSWLFPTLSAADVIGDVAKSGGVGIGQGLINSAGFLGDARDFLSGGVQKAADYFAPGSAPNAGGYFSKAMPDVVQQAPTSSQLQQGAESITGPFYQPKTIEGEYARTIGEFAPSAAMPGSLLGNALRYVLLPALASETSGQLTKGTAAEPWVRAVAALVTAGLGHKLLPSRAAPEIAEALTARGSPPSEAGAAKVGMEAPAIPDVPVPSELVTPVRLQELAALSERAKQFHDILDEFAQSKRTTAILSTDGDTIVASGKRDLTLKQQSLIRAGERAAKLPGAHGEITALSEAMKAGLVPRALATTWTICPECKAVVESLGGVLTGKTTAIFPD